VLSRVFVSRYDESLRPRRRRSRLRFHTLRWTQAAFIPNYGDRYRHDETISTAFVESAVNYVVSKRFVKKQQMRWTQRGKPTCCYRRGRTF
jgi:hypothetical protein